MFYKKSGQFKTSYDADQAMLPLLQDRISIFVILAVAFLVIPLVATTYVINSLLMPFLIYSLAAVGLNILVGYCGQISLGTGGFMAVGAISAWNMIERIPDMPVLAAFLLAGFITSATGVVFGLPALRIKGFYLAVTTLAAQFFLIWLLQQPWFLNYSATGVISAQDISVMGWTINTPVEKYLFVLVVVIVMTLLAKNIVRSVTGRKWMAIRDMDVAAEIIGIRPMATKLQAFAVSSFFIGIAGVLWGYLYLGQLEPAAFDVYVSFDVLFMVIIGGLGSILGSFLGAAFVVLMPLALSFLGGILGLGTAMVAYVETFTFGVLILLFLLAEPHGLAHILSVAKQKMRIWPFPY